MRFLLRKSQFPSTALVFGVVNYLGIPVEFSAWSCCILISHRCQDNPCARAAECLFGEDNNVSWAGNYIIFDATLLQCNL